MAQTTIINLMLGKGRGGLEQAAIDYAEALTLAGFSPMTVVAPGSWAAEIATQSALPMQLLKRRGNWDLAAAWRLRSLIRRSGATAIICHGNRALSLALFAQVETVPVIAVAHNYQTRRFARADAVFAITDHARNVLVADGLDASRIHRMPNMVRTAPVADRAAFRQPPRIGSMGRFVSKKAFDLYIDALALLKQRGVAFTATLGGGGEEEQALRQRAQDAGLADYFTMPGWVSDKQAWFNGLDLFVLPSHHEPFGIVLIEAMAQKIPVIASASEGPREIIASGENGLLTPLGDASALADAMQKLLADAPLARAMGEAGYHDATTRYSPAAMAERLRAALDTIHTGN